MVTRTNEVKDINTVFIYIQNLIKKLSLATVGKDIETVSTSSGGEFSPDVTFFQNIFDTVHPVGETYVQLGGMPFPQELYNKNGIQSTWTNISDDYAGDFLRVCGGNSASTKTPYNIGSVYPYTHQGAELPNIKATTLGSGFVGLSNETGASGAFRRSRTRDAYWQGHGDSMTNLSFDASLGQTNANGSYVPQADSIYRNGGENRPENSAVQIWKRTA